MSLGLKDLNIKFLKTPKKGKKVVLSPLIVSQQVAEEQRLREIPEVQELSRIPGIEPFLIKELIPDLIFSLQKEGFEAVEDAVRRADPKDPQSIIFNHPSQEEHRATQKVETELILNKPEVVERAEIQCMKCGSRRIETAIVQARRADEPATVFAHCVTCERRWKFSSA